MTAIFWTMWWTAFLNLTETGHLQQYEGGYTDYLETKQKRTSQETSESGNALFGKSGKGKSEEGSSKSSRDWKQNRKTN